MEISKTFEVCKMFRSPQHYQKKKKKRTSSDELGGAQIFPGGAQHPWHPPRYGHACR